MTVADLLADAFGFFPPARLALSDCPPGTRCAISGATIEQGYPAAKLQTATMADFADVFRLGGWVGVAAASCLAASSAHGDNRASRSMVAFESRAGHLPLIARESAREQGRPCFSDLIRDAWAMWRDRRCVWIISTSTKRRLWPYARLTTLGESTSVYLHDEESATSARLALNWPRLVACLDAIEDVYTAGVSKRQIGRYVPAAKGHDMRQLIEWERRVAPWRGSSEFTVALLVAQKREEIKNDHTIPAATAAH